MADLDAAPAKPVGKRLPAGELPPVEPPTSTFILQLFLIPLLIVAIVVMLWLGFSWIAHMGRDDPAALAKAIERGDNASWQRAYELADLLRSPDPRYDALRTDPVLAKRLADFLKRDLKEPVSSRSDKERVIRRMYLCRALGSFHVTDGLPVLLEAATLERDPVEVEVRYAALEAIATLAHQMGPGALADDDDEVLKTLLDASREQDDSSTPPPAYDEDGQPTLYRPKAELRAVAAYALGVVGGERAIERLKLMLHDAYPNARYNAATGLARHGEEAAEPVLREMLDPENKHATRDERYANDQARKQVTVLMNGIKATVTLAEANPRANLTGLKASLDRLATSPLDNVQLDRTKVKGTALEALRLLERREL
jgi:HEAT repeat protein